MDAQEGTGLRIALLQMPSMLAPGDAEVDGALEAGIDACERAVAQDAHVIVFPEIWNIGFADDGLPANERLALLHNLAVKGEGDPFVNAYRSFARQYRVVLALGVLRQVGQSLRDSVLIIGRDGRILLTYDKVHTSAFDFEAYFEPGTSFPTAEVETAVGVVRMGAMICYDREFPEAARSLMLAGAEVIVTANCCELDDKRIHQFASRAFENATVMAMTNYSSPLNGRSVLVDAKGEFLLRASEREGVVVGEVSLDDMRMYRATCGWGNAFRRPERYGVLTERVDIPCFRRDDLRGRPFTG